MDNLHQKGFLHRDLKIENTLYNADPTIPLHEKARLIDFGSALPINDKREVIVTDEFGMTSLPLLWKDPQGNFHLNEYTDMFALGETLDRLWNNLLTRDGDGDETHVPISDKVHKQVQTILLQIYPLTGNPISALTAAEASAKFQTTYDAQFFKKN